jgi:hypothetical protein
MRPGRVFLAAIVAMAGLCAGCFNSVSNPSLSPPSPSAWVIIQSSPANAAIQVDGRYRGNTPSTIQLNSGQHVIVLAATGYAAWKKTLTVTAGRLNVMAALRPKSAVRR